MRSVPWKYSDSRRVNRVIRSKGQGVENIKGLNLEVKLTTVQVTLLHKVSKLGTICFGKPGLTEDLYIVQKEEFSGMLYVQYVHLTKAKRIHKRQTHSLVREDVI
jgi:hypothetical protein